MKNSKQRVFIGVILPADTANKLNNLSSYFARDWKFKDSRKYHITIIPHWLVDDIDELLETCRNMELELPKFDLEYTIAEAVWDLDGDQIIWALATMSKEFNFIRKTIAEALQKQIFEDFLIHTTLANNYTQNQLPFEKKKLTDIGFKIEKIELIANIDNGRSSYYKPIYSWKLL